MATQARTDDAWFLPLGDDPINRLFKPRERAHPVVRPDLDGVDGGLLSHTVRRSSNGACAMGPMTLHVVGARRAVGRALFHLVRDDLQRRDGTATEVLVAYVDACVEDIDVRPSAFERLLEGLVQGQVAIIRAVQPSRWGIALRAQSTVGRHLGDHPRPHVLLHEVDLEV